jgi:hypothetical protein
MFYANANGVNGMDVGGASGIGCNGSSVGLDCASGITRGEYGGKGGLTVGGSGFGNG